MKCFSSFAMSAELTVGADIPATGSKWTLNLVGNFQCGKPFRAARKAFLSWYQKFWFRTASFCMNKPSLGWDLSHTAPTQLEQCYYNSYLSRNQSSTGFHFCAWSSNSSGGSTQWKRIVSVSKKSIICFTWTQQRWMIHSLFWSLSLTSLGLSSRCGLSRHVFTRPFMCICAKRKS